MGGLKGRGWTDPTNFLVDSPYPPLFLQISPLGLIRLNSLEQWLEITSTETLQNKSNKIISLNLYPDTVCAMVDGSEGVANHLTQIIWAHFSDKSRMAHPKGCWCDIYLAVGIKKG